jgi:threonine dehydrogenase-like Zn-dependent dehydrogenase
VYHLTEGVGADVVVEASGNPAALRQALPCAAFQGTVVVASWYGTQPVTLDLREAFHRRRLRLVSSQVSTVDPSLQPRWSRLRRLGLAVDLLRQLPLADLVTHRIPFRRAAEAYALVDRRPQEVVQVVLTYGASDV